MDPFKLWPRQQALVDALLDDTVQVRQRWPSETGKSWMRPDVVSTIRAAGDGDTWAEKSPEEIVADIRRVVDLLPDCEINTLIFDDPIARGTEMHARLLEIERPRYSVIPEVGNRAQRRKAAAKARCK